MDSLQYYGFFQTRMSIVSASALEKDGGPMTESRSWTRLSRRSKVDPAFYPALQSVDTPAN